MGQAIGQGKAMLNVMIVDDEPPARARLGQVLRDCSEQVSLQLVGEAEGGISGLEEADRLHPDVILLDVHMPDMNGIEVARHLAQRDNPPAVIFVTAYDEHALDAFEVQALDYLMKPVRAERLVAALVACRAFSHARAAHRRARENNRRGAFASDGVGARAHDAGADRRCCLPARRIEIRDD